MERYAFRRIDRQTVSETNTAEMLEALTPICHVKGGDAQEGPPVLGPQNDIVKHRQARPRRRGLAVKPAFHFLALTGGAVRRGPAGEWDEIDAADAV